MTDFTEIHNLKISYTYWKNIYYDLPYQCVVKRQIAYNRFGYYYRLYRAAVAEIN